MKIDCPECCAHILAEDLDLPTSMAKCRNCNSVFSFAEKMRAPPAFGIPPQASRDKMRAPRPDGLQIQETGFNPAEPGYRDAPHKGGSITVTRRWFAPQFIFFAFFCVAWDGFLFFWYSNVIGSPGPVPFIMAIFPIAHVAAGVGLTYYTIAGFLNSTTIRLDASSLTVRHAPLPWKGNHNVPREDIKQLYCEHEVSQGKNGPNHSYYLSAVLVNESKVRLASMPADQARYIEELLEERLGVVDMAVPGEVGRNDR